MIETEKYFMLFSCCIPVKGATRSIVCDLQRGHYKVIPNGLYEILRTSKKKTLKEIKKQFNYEADETIDEYFNFLIKHEFGIWRDTIDQGFTTIDLQWKRPELVTNAIMDFDRDSDYDYKKVLIDLEDIFCKSLQLRFFHIVDSSVIEDILNFTNRSKLRSIELIVKYDDTFSAEQNLKSLTENFPRVRYIVNHSSPYEKSSFCEFTKTIINYTTQEIDSASHCGEISPYYFSTNIETFTEAQKFNTCLNKKISVDVNGDIKNCPSMNTSFGNVRDTSLHEALVAKDFKSLWEINKDQIEICKDCEFRYICTDCRAFITKPDDRYSKPSKCTYDPYTAKWNAETLNVIQGLTAINE
jgi:SPASM domain peptide maturase of grasp-with-spasm system